VQNEEKKVVTKMPPPLIAAAMAGKSADVERLLDEGEDIMIVDDKVHKYTHWSRPAGRESMHVPFALSFLETRNHFLWFLHGLLAEAPFYAVWNRQASA